ncbi:MAG TPA: hypothetical protein VMB80_02930 [Candidatus Acidoferrum sp.]|nr:hypothetical protein [Candidatus Acidoferrum sp.]
MGPDQVTISDQEVVIEAKHEMPDWQIHTVQVPAIHFEGRKYFLAEMGKTQAPYAIRYVLRPWPQGKIPNPKRFHVYSEDAVAERDAVRRSGVRDEMMRSYLLMFYPFLGLLWSGTQKRLIRLGFLPHALTGISIFTVFSLMFTQMAFIALMLQASARSGSMMIGGMIRAMVSQNYIHIGPLGLPVCILDSLMTLALLTDVLVRYTCYLREDDWAGGFLEWLVPKSLRGTK